MFYVSSKVQIWFPLPPSRANLFSSWLVSPIEMSHLIGSRSLLSLIYSACDWLIRYGNCIWLVHVLSMVAVVVMEVKSEPRFRLMPDEFILVGCWSNIFLSWIFTIADVHVAKVVFRYKFCFLIVTGQDGHERVCDQLASKEQENDSMRERGISRCYQLPTHVYWRESYAC